MLVYIEIAKALRAIFLNETNIKFVHFCPKTTFHIYLIVSHLIEQDKVPTLSLTFPGVLYLDHPQSY